MCISKQTMKNRLHLLLRAALDVIKWIKTDIHARRTQLFKIQGREEKQTEDNLQIVER